MKPRLSVFLLLAVSLAATAGNAAVLEQRSRHGDRVLFLRPQGVSSRTASISPVSEAQAEATAWTFLAQQADRLGLTDPRAQLKVIQVKQDKLGMSHVVFHQEHLGLPVRNASVRVHVNGEGEVYLASNGVVTDLPGNASPMVSAEQALEAAEREGRRLLPEFEERTAVRHEPELVWYPAGRSRGEDVDDTRMMWETHVSFPKCPDGDCEALGALVGVDAGSRGVVYAVQDFHGLDRQAYDCAHAPEDYGCHLDAPGLNGYIHGRSEGQPERGPHNNPAMIQFGSTDVDDGYSILGDMHNYASYFTGRNGANDQGGMRDVYGERHISRIATHNEGPDGNGISFCPGGALLTAHQAILFCLNEIYPDVVAHEYAHAITNWTFQVGGALLSIDYNNPHTRSLSESFSDIIGESFEVHELSHCDWVGGSGRAAPDPWRTLYNPNISIDSDGRNHAARLYDAYTNCDVSADTGGYYITSTIFSYSMYLASEGGEFNGCTIQGQGIALARDVFFRAWDAYFNRSQNFDGAYTLLLQSCQDLYGLDSPEYTNFRTALQAVEVNQAEAPYGGGPCVDPLGLAGEQAPPCAVNHAANALTALVDGTPQSVFQAHQPMHLTVTAGTPDRTVQVHLTPADTSHAIWTDLATQSLVMTEIQLDADGSALAVLFAAAEEGEFDVVVDANADGLYQPWADTVLPVTISGNATDVPALPDASRIVQSVQPNPFNPQTTFRLRLPARGTVSLAIHDQGGRRVRSLLDRVVVEGGEMSVTWDGRDDGGVGLASGVYFYQILSSLGVESGKIAMIK